MLGNVLFFSSHDFEELHCTSWLYMALFAAVGPKLVACKTRQASRLLVAWRRLRHACFLACSSANENEGVWCFPFAEVHLCDFIWQRGIVDYSTLASNGNMTAPCSLREKYIFTDTSNLRVWRRIETN